MSRASVSAVLALGAVAVALPALAQEVGANRYGPVTGAPEAARYAAPLDPSSSAGAPPLAVARMRGRMLSWPGKVAEPMAAPVAFTGAVPAAPLATQAYDRPIQPDPRPAQPIRAAAYEGRAAAPVASPAASPVQRPAPQMQSATADGWRPLFGQGAAAHGAPLAGAPRADLPTSIYTPTPRATASVVRPGDAWAGSRAAAAAPPLRTASADHRYGYDPTLSHGVRFYSVHRAFGIKPDAAPIPPQFFTATADLAEPAGPAPLERSTVGPGTTRTSRVVPDTSAN